MSCVFVTRTLFLRCVFVTRTLFMHNQCLFTRTLFPHNQCVCYEDAVSVSRVFDMRTLFLCLVSLIRGRYFFVLCL